jgi:D-arabinose 1-dehydrogenase-like Zn-dependent alcohol dehydrogenase
MSATLGGLAPHGRLMVLGVAESLEVSPFLLIAGHRSIEGWYSGTSIDSQDTLAFSLQSGVRSLNETFALERAPEAFDRMLSGKARFRVVLTMSS